MFWRLSAPSFGKKGKVPVCGIPRQFADGQLAKRARIKLKHGQAWKDQQDQPKMPEIGWTQHAGLEKGEADPSNRDNPSCWKCNPVPAAANRGSCGEVSRQDPGAGCSA